MSTSSFYLDVSNPLYRDNGCPSQCMSMNEYTILGDYYSFGTDPKTALMMNLATPDSQNTPTNFAQPQPVKLQISKFGLENTDSSNYRGGWSTGYGLPPALGAKQHVVVERKP